MSEIERLTCPTCWQSVPRPQRGDHDYGIPLVEIDVERLARAMYGDKVLSGMSAPRLRERWMGKARRTASAYAALADRKEHLRGR